MKTIVVATLLLRVIGRGTQPATLLVCLTGLGVLSRPLERRPQRMRPRDDRVMSPHQKHRATLVPCSFPPSRPR